MYFKLEPDGGPDLNEDLVINPLSNLAAGFFIAHYEGMPNMLTYIQTLILMWCKASSRGLEALEDMMATPQYGPRRFMRFTLHASLTITVVVVTVVDVNLNRQRAGPACP